MPRRKGHLIFKQREQGLLLLRTDVLANKEQTDTVPTVDHQIRIENIFAQQIKDGCSIKGCLPKGCTVLILW